MKIQVPWKFNPSHKKFEKIIIKSYHILCYMYMDKYINYILILRYFFEKNNYPVEIVWIIIKLVYSNIRIGNGPFFSCSFIYDDEKIYELTDTSQICTMNKLNPQMKSIICGDEYKIGLSHEGNIYAWGSNSRGQLGLGDFESDFFPQKLDLNNINLVACGSYHTMAYEDGKLYGWGFDDSWQLGLENNNGNHILNPTIIPCHAKNILQISCGRNHTICLCDDGSVIGCGDNVRGQLASEYISQSVYIKLTKIYLKNNVISVKCGKYHTMYLLASNEIYVCGSNKNNGLGINPHEYYIYEPTKIDLSIGLIKEIDCGYKYNTILTDEGKLYVCGKISDNISINYWKEFENISNIKTMKCGKTKIIFITHDEKIWIWNGNDDPKELII